MKNSLSKFAALLAVGIGALASAPSAQAIATLTLDDGPGGLLPLVITDGGGGDASGTLGNIAYIGAYGAFTLNITTGSSKPVVGSATQPELSLSTSSTSLGAGSLYIQFSDVDFGPLSSDLHFLAQGAVTSLASGGSVDWSTYGDTANAINGDDGIHAQSSFSTLSAPFSTAVAAPNGGPIGFPYSLTVQMTITHGANGGTTNSSAVLASVPEGGSTVATLGIAMLGVGLLRRKFKKA